MDFSPLSLLFSTLFSIVGFYYFRAGRSEGRALLMLCGAALFIYGFFVSGPWLNLLVGTAIAVAPWGAGLLGLDV